MAAGWTNHLAGERICPAWRRLRGNPFGQLARKFGERIDFLEACGRKIATVLRDDGDDARALAAVARANFERAGFGDEVAQIRECHAAGDRGAAIAAVSDRFVDAIDVMGDAAHVRATVEDYVAAGVDVPVLMPLPWGPDRLAVIRDTMEAAAGV